MKPIGSGDELIPTDLILRTRTDLGFTRDRHIKYASRLRPTCGAPSRRPHPEEARSAVSKDGRWLGLAWPRPSRRAQSFEARAPRGARAPQDEVRAPQDEVDRCVDMIRTSETQCYY